MVFAGSSASGIHVGVQALNRWPFFSERPNVQQLGAVSFCKFFQPQSLNAGQVFLLGSLEI